MSGDFLVIGVGNPDRGDDGAGVLVVRRLRQGRRVVEVTDCSRLLDVWAGEHEVVVIDATISGAEPGTITEFDGCRDRLPTATFRSSHSFGLGEGVEMARALGRLPGHLTIYGIEGSQFGHGQPLSPPVEAAVGRLATHLEGAPG